MLSVMKCARLVDTFKSLVNIVKTLVWEPPSAQIASINDLMFLMVLPLYLSSFLYDPVWTVRSSFGSTKGTNTCPHWSALYSGGKQCSDFGFLHNAQTNSPSNETLRNVGCTVFGSYTQSPSILKFLTMNCRCTMSSIS